MRSYVLPVALCALFATVDLNAQKMGSANSDAPTVSQSIAFANGAGLMLEYKSITWAQGTTMNALKGDSADRVRQRINKSAESNPLGTAKVTKGITLGGKAVAAGEYKVGFTIDDDNNWHMVMTSDAGKVDWKLPLKDAGKMSKRLKLMVSAGDDATEANLAIQFGDMKCEVGCSASAKGAASKPSK